MDDYNDRLSLRQRQAIDDRAKRWSHRPQGDEGFFWLFISLIVGMFLLAFIFALIGGCVQGGKKNITTGATSQPVEIDASESLVSAKIRAAISAEVKAQVTAQVAAQINQIGGNQVINSPWVSIIAILSGPLTVLLDKLSRRSKTIRKIDAAVKGHKKVTVSE